MEINKELQVIPCGQAVEKDGDTSRRVVRYRSLGVSVLKHAEDHLDHSLPSTPHSKTLKKPNSSDGLTDPSLELDQLAQRPGDEKPGHEKPGHEKSSDHQTDSSQNPANTELCHHKAGTPTKEADSPAHSSTQPSANPAANEDSDQPAE